MKKCVWLFLLVLAMSSTALGHCRISITIDPITCGQDITGSTLIQCSGKCTYSHVSKDYVFDNVLFADIYLDCESPCGSSVVTTKGKVFGEAKRDLYVVVVAVWCNHVGCGCFPYCCYSQPVLCGVATKTFTVCSSDCG